MLPEEVICLGLGVAVVCSITDVSAVRGVRGFGRGLA